MSRTVSAWVTAGEDVLGAVGPFPVDVPWWQEVEPVVARLEELLGVPVLVLRLLTVDGGEGGRDGHVTYHVEALERPAPGLLDRRPLDDGLLGPRSALRAPWARAAGLRELLDWAARTLEAAGRPVTGPVEQRRTWNLAALFRLPTAQGPVWLKATPHFAADEGAVVTALAGADPSLVPALLGRGAGRILMEHVPGQDCWGASPGTATAAMKRFVAAQAALAANRPAGLRDGRTPALAPRVDALLDGPAAAGLSRQETAAVRRLTDRWQQLGQCGLPDTVVHGDFHPGNWRSDGGPPVVVDFADAYWGNPVVDGLRAQEYLDEQVGATAARAWAEAWSVHVPGSDPAGALRLAEPLAHLVHAVRYQEFLDGIEPSERPYHAGDPVAALRTALRSEREPSPVLADLSPARREARAATVFLQPTSGGPLATGGPAPEDRAVDDLRIFDPSRRLLLEGLGLRLREWTDADVPDLVALYDDPEIDRWTPVASPFGVEEARSYLAAARRKRAERRSVQLAITTDGLRPRGEILFFRSGPDERELELAYGVGADHRGRGLASRAVRLVVEHAVHETGARSVVLRIEAGNAAGEAVARSAGFAPADDEPVVRMSQGRELVLRTWRHTGS
ncbi:GNAT family N-acetyltransferase [Streptomyces sp. NPDC049097]|uniref:GNAT family N-acetyltransferase n=1 Tax=unclassified Streptomyces TaxID=2593676 RepID=UPI0033C89B13